MKRALGHVVLNVANLERSARFYRRVLGMKEVGRLLADENQLAPADMAFFSFGSTHHDLALRQSARRKRHDAESVGVAHVAFRIGRSLAELKAYRAHLRRCGVREIALRDHAVSQSVYFSDPDGIVLEAYIDAAAAIWRADPSAVATVRPLEL